MKTLLYHYCRLLFFIPLFFSGMALGQTAGLQLIHDALGPGLTEGPTVDIYINGQSGPELRGLPFRSATPFLEVAAGLPLVAGIAISPSVGVTDTLAAFDLGVLEAGTNVVAMLYGTAGDASSPLRLSLRAVAPDLPGQVNLLAFHGSAMPTAIDITGFLGEFSIAGIKYGDFSDAQAFVPGEYFMEVTASGTVDLVGTFQTDFTGRGGQSLVLFSSGLLDADPLFNLFIATPDGQVEPFLPVALVQIIHNSPDPSLALTDVWLTGDLGLLLLDDFAYLEATPVAFFPTRLVFDIGFAPPGSSDASEVEHVIEAVSFTDGRQYTVFVGGLPGDSTFPLQLFINDQAKLLATDPEAIALSVFHGIPGAGAVDIDLRETATLAMDLAYGQFSPYVEQEPAPGVWVVKDAATGAPLASFAGDLGPAAGFAVTLFAGGYPEGDPPMGLYAVFADGQVLPLDPITRVQLIHNAPAEAFDVYLNGERIVNDLVFRDATPFIDLPTRIAQEISLLPWSASPGSEPVAVFDPLTLEDGREYLLVIAGVNGSIDQPLRLEHFDEVRMTAENEQESALLFFHGAPDAPALDLFAGTDTSPVFAGVGRGDFAGYASLPATVQNLVVRAAGGDQMVFGEYALDLRELAGRSAFLFATGYLEAGQIAPFEIWIALADGTTRPLSGPTATRQQEKLKGKLLLWPNPAPGGANLEFQLARSSAIDLKVTDGQGRQVRSYNLGWLSPGDHRLRLDTGGLPSGLFFVVLKAGAEVQVARLIIP